MTTRVIVLFAALFLSATHSYACFAPPIGPTKSAIQKSKFVFKGKPVSSRKSYLPFSDYYVTKFEITHIHKGNKRQHISVRYPATQDYPGGRCNLNVKFKIGEFYKVALKPSWFFATTDASYAQSEFSLIRD